MKLLSFPKKDRILKRYEFLAFYSSGKAIHSQGFVLAYKRGQFGNSRIGITVSRKVGHAVIRNLVKRRIREFFRLHRRGLPECWEFHVIARKPADSLSFQQTNTMLEELFRKFKKFAGGAENTTAAIGQR